MHLKAHFILAFCEKTVDVVIPAWDPAPLMLAWEVRAVLASRYASESRSVGHAGGASKKLRLLAFLGLASNRPLHSAPARSKLQASHEAFTGCLPMTSLNWLWQLQNISSVNEASFFFFPIPTEAVPGLAVSGMPS